MVNTSYVVAAGLNGGQQLTGGIGSDDKMIINGTTSSDNGNSLVVLQNFPGGNVSIGSTTPANTGRLYIDSGARSNYVHFVNDATGKTSGNGFLVGLNSDGWSTIKTYENERIEFGTNNLIRGVMAANGNFGWGTETPVMKMEIGSSSSDDLFNLTSTRNVGSANIGPTLHLNRGVANARTGDQLNIVDAYSDSTTTMNGVQSQIKHISTITTHTTRSSALSFWTMASGTLAERMSINATGLKIGTIVVNDTYFRPQKCGATASVANAGTITHAWGATPTYVLVTGTNRSQNYAVTAKSSTTFTMEIGNSATLGNGAADTIYWCVG
jgi:hypothetical protein